MCKHENAIFIEERVPGPQGRDYIERLSAEDKKYRINSLGRAALDNAWGEIQLYCPDCKEKYPVMCGHGGSMWLCRGCKEEVLKRGIWRPNQPCL